MKELIEYAKANPGKLNYGSQGNGQIGHLAVEQLKFMTGTQLVHVPFRGSAPAITDLVAGNIDVLPDLLPATKQLIEAKKIKVIAVASPMRLAALPDFVPLLVGSGVVAGLEAASYTTGSQSLDMTARLGLRGYGDLVVRQSFDGNTAVSEASSFLLAIVSYITQNPLERVDVESVEVDLAQTDQPVFANLVGANASRTVVRPGDRVMLNLDFVPYRGDRFRHSMPLATSRRVGVSGSMPIPSAACARSRTLLSTMPGIESPARVGQK
jgi:hypothetical protein